jgi:hypothetical protein
MEEIVRYDLREAIENEAKMMRELVERHRLANPNSRIVGLNLEGPYLNAEEYVLKNGRVYEPNALDEYEQRIVFDAARIARKRGCAFPPKECFANSQALVLGGNGQIKYVEGFFRSVIPIHHAWASINGKVIDTTMRFGNPFGGTDHGPQRVKVIPDLKKARLGNRVYGVWWDDAAYFGVEFTRFDVRKHHDSDEPFGSLIQTTERLTGKVI